MRRLYIIVLLAVLVIVSRNGCDHPFDKSQLPQPGPVSSIGDTNYIEIQPPWFFNNPRAVMVGRDNLIYVADDSAVIMMDAGGAVLDRRAVISPMCMAQNSTLDLYIGGATLGQNPGDTLGALYRLSLVRFDTTFVDTLTDTLTGTKTFIKHDTSTFYDHRIDIAPLRVVQKDAGHPQRRYVGIGILPDNSYLVARVGPDNSSFVDPDSRVLLFNSGDTLVTPVPELQTGCGTAINNINQLTGLTVFKSSRDYVVTQTGNCEAYGAIWMVYQSTAVFQGWAPKYDPLVPGQQFKDFIQPNRFKAAAGSAIDPRRGDVFIIDAQLDSVVKFDRNGNFRPESFGKSSTANSTFPHGLNNPLGIAFSSDCTLYIADTGNHAVRRFKLSSQTNCQ